MRNTMMENKTSSFWDWFKLPRKDTVFLVVYPPLDWDTSQPAEPWTWLTEETEYSWYWIAAVRCDIINRMAGKYIAFVVERREKPGDNNVRTSGN